MTFSGGELKFKSVKFFINPTFEKLFPRKQSTIDAIAEDMGNRGFNKAHPLILADWPEAEEPCLLDGHTRALAALKAGVEPIFVPVMKFDSESEALDYAIYLQKERRNLTDAELASCLEALDSIKTAGRPQKELAGCQANLKKGKSADITAKKLGISRDKVEKARAVLSAKTPIRLKEAVKSGEKSINAAYNEMRGALKPLSYTPGPVTMLPLGSSERDRRTIEWLVTVWSGQQYNLDKWDEALKVIEEEKIFERYPPEEPAGSLGVLIENIFGFSVEKSKEKIEDQYVSSDEDDIMVSVPINSPHKLTEIIHEHYRPDQITIIIDMLKRRMAA